MKNIKVGTYKPFLEVIQEMKHGDIADCQDAEYGSVYKQGSLYYIIEKDEIPNTDNHWNMSERDFNQKYKIRPRYVGWEKALGAAEAGKEVEWYLPEHKGVGKWLTFDLSTTLNYAVDGLDITFRDLLESRFLIKEDK